MFQLEMIAVKLFPAQNKSLKWCCHEGTLSLRGLPHYGNWGLVMWTIVPASFQSKCLHLITLPMVMYHTTDSLAPRQSTKNQNLEACDETVRKFST
jgi:hypothetical protein